MAMRSKNKAELLKHKAVVNSGAIICEYKGLHSHGGTSYHIIREIQSIVSRASKKFFDDVEAYTNDGYITVTEANNDFNTVYMEYKTSNGYMIKYRAEVNYYLDPDDVCKYTYVESGFKYKWVGMDPDRY